nr:alpha/beta fold hydrolase [Allomuricauda sp.]
MKFTRAIYIFYLFLILPGPTVFSQDSKVETVAPELLFKESTQSNFRISPNGNYFLEVIEEGYESVIIVIDIDAYKLKNRIPLGVTGIQNVSWLTDNRLIYERLGEVLAIDIDGTNKVKLIDRKAEKKVKNYYKYYRNYRINSVMSLDESNEDEIIVEAKDLEGYAYVKKVNVFTGEKETILDGRKYKVNNWIADKNGKVVIGVKYTDKGWKYCKQNEETGDWVPIFVNLDGKFHPFESDGESMLKEQLIFVDTDYDPDIIYIASNIGTDKRELLKYNMRKQYVVEKILSDTNCDVVDDQGFTLRMLFDGKKRQLGAVRYEGILPEFHAFSEDYMDLQQKLGVKYNTYVNDVIDVDKDNRKFVIHQWSDISSGNIGIYDREKDSYAVMFHFNEELNEHTLSKTRTLATTTPDGSRLTTYLNLPLDYDDAGQFPLVVIPHGGPWVRDYWELDGFSQFFASRGYAVLRVNYRGSTGFGKKHLQDGIEGLNTTMIDDIVAATNEVKATFKINPDHVFIFGHSYGGYATYMALARYPDLYRAGVALAAPTDVRDLMKKQKKEGMHFSYEFWKHALGNNGPSYYDEISPINHVEKINSPLLVFHGKFDKIIPIEQAVEMEKQFKKSGKKNGTFRTIEFLGHSLRDSNSLGYILKEAHEFFQEKSN